VCGVGTGTYCRQIFKTLTVTSLYVQDIINFIKKYKFSLEQKVRVHDYNTRKKWIYMFCHVIQIS